MATGQQAPLPASNIAAIAARAGGAPSGTGIGDFLDIAGQTVTWTAYGYMAALLEVQTEEPASVNQSGDSIELFDHPDDGPLIRLAAGIYAITFGGAPHGTAQNAEEPGTGWGALTLMLGHPTGPPPDYLDFEPIAGSPLRTILPLGRITDNNGGFLIITATFVIAAPEDDAIITPVVALDNAPADWTFNAPVFNAIKIG